MVPRAGAWGNFGHESVALAAWGQLSSTQQAAMNKIFAGAPSIYGSKTGQDALLFAATWPDVLREGHEHGGHLSVDLHIFNPLAPVGAKTSSDSVIDNLHFADSNSATDDSLAEPNDNVANGVTLALAALQNKSSTALQKGEAVAYLIHCVGDAHQPLHAGNKADLGGNEIKTHAVGGEEDLHAVWDTGFFATTKQFVKGSTPPTDFVAQVVVPLFPAVKKQAMSTLKPADWVTESHQLAKTSAYVDENGKTIVSGATLSETYVSSRLTVAEQRVATAALRLAALLEQSLPGK